MNQQHAGELGVHLSDFDRARIVVREPRKRMTLSSVEMGQNGDCAIEIRNAAKNICFAYTAKGEQYIRAAKNGDGFIVCLGDSIKVVIIDAMGFVAEPAKGPEIITQTFAHAAEQEAPLINDVYDAEQALVDFGTDNRRVNKYHRESHIPFSTLVGCRISQTTDKHRLEVV